MDTDGSASMSLLDHLEEFRMVIFRILICLIILILPALYFAQDAVDLLIKYGCPENVTLQYFSPLEPLWVRIRVAVVIAVIVAVPYIAWQLWGFIAPGLYKHEKMFLSRLAVASWILFLVGGFLGFKYIIPLVMKFSLAMGSDRLQPMIGIEAFSGMAGMTFIGFGVMAQCPVIIYLLIKTGIVEAATLKRQRPVVIVIILVLSAFLTPPDVVSQLIMGVPAYVLFEASLLLAGIGGKKKITEHIVGDPPEDNKTNDVTPEPVAAIDDCNKNEPESNRSYPEPRSSRRKLRYSGTGRRRRK